MDVDKTVEVIVEWHKDVSKIQLYHNYGNNFEPSYKILACNNKKISAFQRVNY